MPGTLRGTKTLKMGLKPGSGGKPSCLCGECKVCRHREINRAYHARRFGRPTDHLPTAGASDAELERRLLAKFRAEGWD